MVLEVDIDITERINLETELKEKERLATIGETAAMVGHDIRNPLQAILGDLYLIASEVTLLPDGKEKENIKESLSALRNNVEYINKIIQDLQDYAKIQHPNFQDVDFERVVQNLLVNNDFPKNIDVAYTLDEDARRFIADPDFLRRILNNLVSNAVHAMPEGGKLDIQARKENGDVFITVQDSGVGVSAEHKDKLFTPLFTTKAKGQGFGLAVVKRLTEALGGTVTFES
jgi:signal transduction histidine kinase